MSATLKLTREGVGTELRRGTFEVFVDGKSVRSIERHDTIEVPVEPERHSLSIRKGRYKSPDRAFDLADGGGPVGPVTSTARTTRQEFLVPPTGTRVPRFIRSRKVVSGSNQNL